MTESLRIPSGVALVARGLVLAIGAAFIAWAFSADVRIVGGPGFGATQTAVLTLGLFNIAASLLRVPVILGLLVSQGLLALTLVVTEAGLRATLSHRYYAPYQLNPRYLYDLVPGVRREHRILPVNGGSNIYKVNSLGFRGEDFPAQRTDQPRVVVYGDSFIHAEYTALENTLVRQLQHQLTERAGRPVEVINAGVAGYGPDQVLRRVEDELPWLQPDLLIVAVFTGNDFGDLVRNKIYRVGPDGALLENAYTFSDEIILNARLDRSEFILKKVIRAAAHNLLALLRGSAGDPFDLQQAMEAALQQHLREYQEYVIEGDNVVRELRSDPYSADISLLPDSPAAYYKLRLMEAVIRQIGLTVDAAEVPLLLVSIPHPMDVMEGDHASGRIDRTEYPDYQPRRLTDSMQAIADRHGLMHLNLYAPFQSVADPASLFLLEGDDHWNDAGQRYAARLIADFLQEKVLLGAQR